MTKWNALYIRIFSNSEIAIGILKCNVLDLTVAKIKVGSKKVDCDPTFLYGQRQGDY